MAKATYPCVVDCNCCKRIFLFILMAKLIVPKKGILVPKYFAEDMEARKKASEFVRKQIKEYEKNNNK